MHPKTAILNATLSVLRKFGDLRSDHIDGNCVVVLQYMVPLGGCVHATPMLQAIHESLCDMKLLVATHGIGLEVLRHNPYVDCLVGTPNALTHLNRAGLRLQQELSRRGLRPAWVLNDLSNRRSRIAMLNPLYLRGRLAGFNLAKALQHITLERDPSVSMIANNVRLARVIGANGAIAEPQVYTSSEAAQQARKLLQEIAGEKPVAVFATEPSGGQPSAWHPGRMAALAELLAQRGWVPVFTGTGGQSSAIDRLRSHVRGTTANIAGKTDIPVLAAMLALADLCVSIDTGTMHVARSSGVPMLVLAPTYQDPIEWLPLALSHIHVLRGEGTRPAPPGYMLDEITLVDATTALDKLVRNYPPDPAQRRKRLTAILSDADHLIC